MSTCPVDQLIGDLSARKVTKDTVLIESARLAFSQHHGTADMGSQILDQLGEVAAALSAIVDQIYINHLDLSLSPILGRFLGIDVGHRAALNIIHPKLQDKVQNGYGILLQLQPLGTAIYIRHIAELIRIAAVIVYIVTTPQGKLGQPGQFLVPPECCHPGSWTQVRILTLSHGIPKIV